MGNFNALPAGRKFRITSISDIRVEFRRLQRERLGYAVDARLTAASRSFMIVYYYWPKVIVPGGGR